MPDKILAGHVAIVTGGGRGIGRAIALSLAAAGAKVTITAARQPAETAAVAEEIEAVAGKGTVLPLQADVTRHEDCDTVVARTMDAFGRIDVLVNNAGRGHRFVYEANRELPEAERLKFWNVPSDVWRMIVHVNVNGPFLMAKAAAPHLLTQARATGRARIINIVATFNTMQKGGNAPYGVTKAALESATQIWARDLAGTGVTVNGLLPGGATATGMIYESNSERPGRKLLDPAIMGPPAVWLASAASDGVTGRRIEAKSWDASLPPERAAQGAFAPPALPPIAE
jgi:NAD(P)-dependent dehydrogenase (short-subunit alcohol dehydrogenase family)